MVTSKLLILVILIVEMLRMKKEILRIRFGKKKNAGRSSSARLYYNIILIVPGT